MQDLAIYQGEDSLSVAQDVKQVDTAFLATWLHCKSAKTQRAYTGDIRRFYGYVQKSLV